MLTTISNLPAKKLGESCYHAMFYSCDKLTNIPNLPATVLEKNCYNSMFCGCTNLISAKNVKINSTVCSESACNNMFTGCSKLQEPPELAFEQIDKQGCYQMFYECNNLKYTPKMNLRSVGSQGLENAFYNCYSITSGFGELNLTDEIISEKAFYCCYYNCSSLIENIPTVFPNTQLSTSCFAYMFYGCSSLSSAPELPATKLGDNCYSSLFYGCTSLTQAPVLKASVLNTGCYLNMFNGCTSLTSITVNFDSFILIDEATQQQSYPTTDWLTNVASNGTFTYYSDLEIPERNGTFVPENWEIKQKMPLTFTAEETDTAVRFYFVTNDYPDVDLSKIQYRTKMNNESAWSEWQQYEIFTRSSNR
jgi:hypothetical protein